jgi:hypothetical protein
VSAAVGDRVRLLDAPEHPWEKRVGRVFEVVDGVAGVWHAAEHVDKISRVAVERLEVVPPPPPGPPARIEWMDDLVPLLDSPGASLDSRLEYDRLARVHRR